MFFKEIDGCGENVVEELSKYLKISKVVHLMHVHQDNLFEYYNDLLNKLGEPIPMDEDVASGNKTGKNWIDIKYDATYAATSYRHSDKRQPLHTDGSYESNAPDINFFFCVEKAKVGGATTFIDSKRLVDCLAIYNPALLKQLQDTPVVFGKGGDSKTKPIITKDGNDFRINWNYFRYQDRVNLCEAFHDFLEHKVVEGGLLTPVSLEPGEAVFFNDELVLHGRNSFIGDRFLCKGGFKWK